MRWLFGMLGIGLIAGLVVVVMRQPKDAADTNTANTSVSISHKGVSLSPRSFEGDDFSNFFVQAGQLGNMVTWVGDIAELGNAEAAPHVVAQLGEQHNLIPVSVAVVPITTLESEAQRRDAQLQAIAFAEQYHPAYLGIGNEVNFQYKDAPDAFASFVSFFAETLEEVKKVSPDTKVVTVWQLEWLKGLHGGLFGGQNDPRVLSQWFLFEQFPEADIFAFTSYPTLIYPDPAEIPDDYFSEISTYTEKPVAFTELGWLREGPNGWRSSPEEQASAIERIFALTAALHPVFRVWPFLYPQPIDWPFSQIYLLPADQETSPAFQAWQAAE